MNKAKLIYDAYFAVLLTTATASAQEYPAAYFQPKVIYSAETESAVKTVETPPNSQNTSEQTQFDPKYPAANFQPKVIYRADNDR